KGSDFVIDKGWSDKISKLTNNWDINKFKANLSELDKLRLQEDEKQNDFKLSYYVDNPEEGYKLYNMVKRIIKDICDCAEVIYSLDEKHNIGLLDILPKDATKLEALEYLQKKLNLKKDDVVYCGDSGNDIPALTAGYNSILVRNSIPDVRRKVKNSLAKKSLINRLYISRGFKKLNGYYVSGIIEGLINLGLVSTSEIQS
ncbi:MAG: HAD-IIB family hydrolase, partial [Nanobdellota archaeon]